ncbi:hypothetical protein QAD02_023992 [Eretmocerus hayati]|uniref:Uncharacterized protein n=1 Tax=Eretmocerus hayati TaxID=131215 RepID=A0ACC2Q0V8_9HYME|nr:hypothetical protein QAD02_023992 [Eretmocerus hayati]
MSLFQNERVIGRSSYPYPMGNNLNKNITNNQKLVSAVLGGNLQLTRQLVGEGADVNFIDPNGRTCLMYAVEKNSYALTHVLLSAGADPTCHNNKHCQPLYSAIQFGNTEVVKMLISALQKAGSVIDTGTVFLAVELKQPDIVRLLLESGVGTVSSEGKTILIHVLENKYHDPKNNDEVYLDILKVLLDHDSAIIHGQFRDQHNPFKIVLEKGKVADVLLFIDYGVQLHNCGVSLPLHCAAINKNDVLEILIERTSFDIEEKDSDAYTVLHKAVSCNNVNQVEMLLHHGANVNTTAHRGVSPLTTAVKNNFLNCAEILLDSGAHVNHKLENSYTPLIIAFISNHSNCVELLLDNGADYLDIWGLVDSSVGIRQDPMRAVNRHIARLQDEAQYAGHDDRDVNGLILRTHSFIFSLRSEAFASDYLTACKSELIVLQSALFVYPITLYQVLVNEIPPEYLNEANAQILKSGNVTKKFPIYGRKIVDVYKRAKSKSDFEKGVIQGLNKILPFDVQSFHMVAENIRKRLCPRDLRILSRL